MESQKQDFKFKIFVINLDKDLNRMEHMKKNMDRVELEFERFSAIDGRSYDWSKEYDELLALQKNGFPLSEGERGCALSHKRVLEIAKNQDLDYVMIMEDDVCVPENFKKIITSIIDRNQKNNTWEYISFDYFKPGFVFIIHWIKTIKRNFYLKYADKNIFTKIQFWTYSFLKAFYIFPMVLFEILRDVFYKKCTPLGGPVKFYRPLYLAGCYIVSRSGIEKILHLTNPIVYPADRVQNEAKKQLGLKYYAYAPCSVFQNRTVLGSSILGVDTINFV